MLDTKWFLVWSSLIIQLLHCNSQLVSISSTNFSFSAEEIKTNIIRFSIKLKVEDSFHFHQISKIIVWTTNPKLLEIVLDLNNDTLYRIGKFKKIKDDLVSFTMVLEDNFDYFISHYEIKGDKQKYYFLENEKNENIISEGCLQISKYIYVLYRKDLDISMKARNLKKEQLNDRIRMINEKQERKSKLRSLDNSPKLESIEPKWIEYESMQKEIILSFDKNINRSVMEIKLKNEDCDESSDANNCESKSYRKEILCEKKVSENGDEDNGNNLCNTTSKTSISISDVDLGNYQIFWVNKTNGSSSEVDTNLTLLIYTNYTVNIADNNNQYYIGESVKGITFNLSKVIPEYMITSLKNGNNDDISFKINTKEWTITQDGLTISEGFIFVFTHNDAKQTISQIKINTITVPKEFSVSSLLFKNNNSTKIYLLFHQNIILEKTIVKYGDSDLPICSCASITEGEDGWNNKCLLDLRGIPIQDENKFWENAITLTFPAPIYPIKTEEKLVVYYNVTLIPTNYIIYHDKSETFSLSFKDKITQHHIDLINTPIIVTVISDEKKEVNCNFWQLCDSSLTVKMTCASPILYSGSFAIILDGKPYQYTIAPKITFYNVLYILEQSQSSLKDTITITFETEAEATEYKDKIYLNKAFPSCSNNSKNVTCSLKLDGLTHSTKMTLSITENELSPFEIYIIQYSLPNGKCFLQSPGNFSMNLMFPPNCLLSNLGVRLNNINFTGNVISDVLDDNNTNYTNIFSSEIEPGSYNIIVSGNINNIPFTAYFSKSDDVLTISPPSNTVTSISELVSESFTPQKLIVVFENTFMYDADSIKWSFEDNTTIDLKCIKDEQNHNNVNCSVEGNWEWGNYYIQYHNGCEIQTSQMFKTVVPFALVSISPTQIEYNTTEDIVFTFNAGINVNKYSIKLKNIDTLDDFELNLSSCDDVIENGDEATFNSACDSPTKAHAYITDLPFGLYNLTLINDTVPNYTWHTILIWVDFTWAKTNDLMEYYIGELLEAIEITLSHPITKSLITSINIGDLDLDIKIYDTTLTITHKNFVMESSFNIVITHNDFTQKETKFEFNPIDVPTEVTLEPWVFKTGHEIDFCVEFNHAIILYKTTIEYLTYTIPIISCDDDKKKCKLNMKVFQEQKDNEFLFSEINISFPSVTTYPPISTPDKLLVYTIATVTPKSNLIYHPKTDNFTLSFSNSLTDHHITLIEKPIVIHNTDNDLTINCRDLTMTDDNNKIIVICHSKIEFNSKFTLTIDGNDYDYIIEISTTYYCPYYQVILPSTGECGYCWSINEKQPYYYEEKCVDYCPGYYSDNACVDDCKLLHKDFWNENKKCVEKCSYHYGIIDDGSECVKCQEKEWFFYEYKCWINCPSGLVPNIDNNCNRAEDFCKNNDCGDYGTCEEIWSLLQCKCERGYYGSYCDVSEEMLEGKMSSWIKNILKESNESKVNLEEKMDIVESLVHIISNIFQSDTWIENASGLNNTSIITINSKINESIINWAPSIEFPDENIDLNLIVNNTKKLTKIISWGIVSNWYVLKSYKHNRTFRTLEENQDWNEKLIANINSFVNTMNSIMRYYYIHQEVKTLELFNQETGIIYTQLWTNTPSNQKSYEQASKLLSLSTMNISGCESEDTLFVKTEWLSEANKLITDNKYISNAIYIKTYRSDDGTESPCNKTSITLKVIDDIRIDKAIYKANIIHGIDVWWKNSPPFSRICYKNSEYNFDVTQKYRHDIFANVSLKMNNETCNYQGADEELNEVHLECSTVPESITYRIETDKLNDNVKREYNLVFNCPGLFDNIRKNIAFWLFIFGFWIIFFSTFAQIILLRLNKTAYMYNEALFNDKLIQKKFHKVQSVINCVVSTETDLKEKGKNKIKENVTQVAPEPSLVVIIKRNFIQYYPFTSLFRQSIIYPILFSVSLFIMNILWIFGFNSMWFTESQLNMRITESDRNSVFYPLRKEGGRVFGALILSVLFIWLVKALIITTFNQRKKLKQAVENLKTINEIKRACLAFIVNKALRYGIAGLLISCFYGFCLYYSFGFCSIYNHAQYGILYSTIWGLLFNWILFLPIYIIIYSVVEKFTQVESQLTYYMKYLTWT